jgi:hypothetical protein
MQNSREHTWNTAIAVSKYSCYTCLVVIAITENFEYKYLLVLNVTLTPKVLVKNVTFSNYKLP